MRGHMTRKSLVSGESLAVLGDPITSGRITQLSSLRTSQDIRSSLVKKILAASLLGQELLSLNSAWIGTIDNCFCYIPVSMHLYPYYCFDEDGEVSVLKNY